LLMYLIACNFIVKLSLLYDLNRGSVGNKVIGSK
jgi:hypothetical protein